MLLQVLLVCILALKLDVNMDAQTLSEARQFAEQLIIAREGVRDVVYDDPVKKSSGLLTAGIGHLLTDQEKKQFPIGSKVPQKTILKWFQQDFNKAFNAAVNQAKALGVFDPEFIGTLASVNFQLGPNWFKEHKKTWQLMEQGRFPEAAKEVYNSLWAKQTPVRVHDFAMALRKVRNRMSPLSP